MFKKLFCYFCFIFSVNAFATDLIIVNKTTDYFSFNINGTCSTKVSQGSALTMPAQDFGDLCSHNTIDCRANAYPNDHCEGDRVAEVMFDTRIGVRGVETYNKNYQFTHPFDSKKAVRSLVITKVS